METVAHEVVAVGFFCGWLSIGPVPYTHKYIVLSALLNKNILFFSFILLKYPDLQWSTFVLFREFTNPGLDPSLRLSLWRMISLYLEATQDIFENSPNLGCSEHRLIGRYFVSVLLLLIVVVLSALFHLSERYLIPGTHSLLKCLPSAF